jgi:hypothetical protein
MIISGCPTSKHPYYYLQSNTAQLGLLDEYLHARHVHAQLLLHAVHRLSAHTQRLAEADIYAQGAAPLQGGKMHTAVSNVRHSPLDILDILEELLKSRV